MCVRYKHTDNILHKRHEFNICKINQSPNFSDGIHAKLGNHE
jgi:hypothetical protein